MRSKRTQLLTLSILACGCAVGAAAAETLHEEHTFTARPGAKVVVDVSFHEVEVTARPGDTIDVVVDLEVGGSGSKAERRLEELRPVFRDDGDTLLIRSVRKGGFSWGSWRAKGHVVVEMPPDMNLVVDASSGSCDLRGNFGDAKVTCDLSSGAVRVAGAARELVADTSSGSVKAELTRPAERVVADTSSGSVTVIGGAAWVHADTSSGSIHVAGLAGDASLDTSSGSITAHWASVPSGAEITADTSSGGVKLTFPAGTTLEGDVDTGSGTIRSDFPGEWTGRSHLQLTGGPGAVSVRVDTSSGGVQLIAQ
jgi:hypothetical protein